MTNPNDSAFTGPTETGYESGMTKLEFLSVTILQGMLAAGTIHHTEKQLAIKAVSQAQALIIELNHNQLQP